MTPPESLHPSPDSRKVDWICLLVLLALPAAWYWRVTSGAAVFVDGDIAGFHAPYYRVAAEAWHAGRAPLWNRHMFSGMPLLAGQQAAPFYPPNIVLWSLLPSWVAMQVTMLLHLGATGAGVFLWLRALKLRAAAAALGALVLMFGGFTMCHIGNVGILRALPWIPLAMFGYTRWVEERRSRWLVCVSFSTACLLVSGFPQIVAYGALFVGTYVLFGVRAGWRAVAGGLAALAIGAGLAAIQFWPGLVAFEGQDLLRHTGGFLDAMRNSAQHPHYLIAWLFPRVYADGAMPNGVGYLGVAPLLLALWGVIAPLRGLGRARAFACVWAVAALLLSFGAHIYRLGRLVHHVPVFGRFGVPSNHLLELTLAAALLAALGLDAVLARRRPGMRSLAGAIAVVAVIVVLWSFGNGQGYSERVPPIDLSADTQDLGRQLVLLWVSAAASAGLWYFNRGPRAAWLSVALLALSAADMVLFAHEAMHMNLTTSNTSIYTRPPAAAEYVLERQGVFPERVMGFDANGLAHPPSVSKELLGTNYFMSFGVESMLGHDGLVPAHYDVAVEMSIPSWGETHPEAVESHGFREALDLFGARWLMVEHEKSAPVAARYPFVRSFDAIDFVTRETSRVDLYENPTALPRLFGCVPAVEIEEAPDGTYPGIWLAEESGRCWVVRSDQPRIERLEPLEYAPGLVRASVTSARPLLLVHGATSSSGWKAYVDGERSPLRRLRGALDGVFLPAGRHEVEFRYAPESWLVGQQASLCSVLALVLLTMLARKRSSPPV